jgi:tetratricopeptide (TPR) repeat protein
MNSKILPLAVGLVVLLAGAVFLLGRTLIETPRTTPLPGVAVTGVAGAGDAPSVPERSANSNPALTDGLQALAESRLDDALLLLEGIPEDDPAFLAARFNIGIAHERAGDGVAAVRALLDVAERQDESADLYAALGRAYSLTQQYELAERVTLRSIELETQHLPARYLVAFVRVAHGRLIDAIAAYNRAVSLDPAQAYLAQALADLERLHTARPDHPGTHYALAFLANAGGRESEEIVELDHYLELGPEGPAVSVAEERRKALAAAAP